ncbi:hypothetical protein DH2020_007503 [Rehmannia glutinosa]|uniref:WEB family protein n=1 Tax=Rehmannia glutinosa TaxID=99300 RepID=A0ABR0TYB7_REHGL
MEGGGATVVNRAEIDTSAPFRSVREAVMLFGERVLAGEVYANKLKEDETSKHGHGAVASELEETKQSLQKAREESIHMAQFLSSLQQELEQTKNELQQLKTRASDRNVWDLEIEDVKFVENSREVTEQVKTHTINNPDDDQSGVEFQKKKCVSFANHPSVAQVIVPSPPSDQAMLQRHPSLKKKKKKQLIPFIAGIFSKKRGSCDAALA